MTERLPPSSEPDLDLPMRGTPLVLFAGIVGSFGFLAAFAAIFGMLGIVGVISAGGASTTAYWIELALGLPIAVLLVFLVRQYLRRRLQIFGTEIWLTGGMLRTERRLVADLADVDAIAVVTRGPAQASSVDLDLRSRTTGEVAIVRGVTEYGADGQRQLYDYLSRYATVSGSWSLGFGRSIKTGRERGTSRTD